MSEITVRGLVAALLTPFDSRGAVDWEALAAQAAGVEAAGVQAICVGGTASELAGSTAAEFGQVCKSARSSVRIPMLASIYPDSTLEAIELGRAAADAGASVLLVAQPHYLFQPGADNFGDMLQQVRRNVPLPLMVANTVRTAMLSTTDLRRLVDRGVIDGIVQGAGEAHILADLLCLPARPLVYSAIDELAYLSYLLKADGMVSTLAAVFPAECVEIYKAQKTGEHDRARRMHERLLRIWRALDHPSELLARLKLAAALRGRPAGVARSPYQAASPETGNNLRELLVREGMIA